MEEGQEQAMLEMERRAGDAEDEKKGGRKECLDMRITVCGIFW